jgi:glycosyltransferase involved in cell wall biosynthesis
VLTIQIITKNSAKTLRRCLDSVSGLADYVVVGDLGSVDETEDICRSVGARFVSFSLEGDMSKARNSMISEGSNMYLEPWEFVARGGELIRDMKGPNAFYVVQGGFVSKQTRFWDRGEFVNPVFERLSGAGDAKVNPGVVVVSSEEPDNRKSKTEACMAWAEAWPTRPDPHYYLACSLLAEGRTDEFMAEATKYMSIERGDTDSLLLMNYYMSKAEASKRMFERASKRAMRCVASRPTFAEFWCLLGDLFYAAGRFAKAKEMYENARIIGKMRKNDDMFPIEIAKYRDYPESMEKRCDMMNKEKFVVAKTVRVADR